MTWREGARRGDPADLCPTCGASGGFTYEFSKFGKHSLHVCLVCRVVYVDGKKQSDVTVGGA